MKLSVFVPLLAAAILASGCVFHRHQKPAPAPATPSVIVTPDNSLGGKVVSFNSAGRFVVLNFPAGPLPVVGQTLFLYRNGLKVAEVKTSTWQRESYIVADLVTGEARPGDEVRNQ